LLKPVGQETAARWFLAAAILLVCSTVSRPKPWSPL